MSSQNETELVLDKSRSEILVFGCVRIWYLLYFPDVLCHLILHYYGTKFLWTIYEKDLIANRQFESKPFMINNIIFQSRFIPNKQVKNSKDEIEYAVELSTKILSMPNTIRTCTAYYEYSILSNSFRSRHTFNLAASRASLPKRFMDAIDVKKIDYPLHIFLTLEPIRIHHWSMDKMIDYQQDVLMKEYVKYQWQINTVNENRRYLQSETFGICWCLDLDLVQGNLFLKLLRLAPNINRIKVECLLKARWLDKALIIDKEIEFTFINVGVCIKLNSARQDAKKFSKMLRNKKKTKFALDIEVRIIEAYEINEVDDFETNDKVIPINKWTQYGIIS